MTTSSIFSVSSDDLARLDFNQAVDLLAQLLWSEATSIGLPTTHVHITKRTTVKDGGIDARVEPKNGIDHTSSFFPPGRTGLQVKAGHTFKPTEGQIRKELFDGKPASREALGSSVRECLDAAGTYRRLAFLRDERGTHDLHVVGFYVVGEEIGSPTAFATRVECSCSSGAKGNRALARSR